MRKRSIKEYRSLSRITLTISVLWLIIVTLPLVIFAISIHVNSSEENHSIMDSLIMLVFLGSPGLISLFISWRIRNNSRVEERKSTSVLMKIAEFNRQSEQQGTLTPEESSGDNSKKPLISFEPINLGKPTVKEKSASSVAS